MESGFFYSELFLQIVGTVFQGLEVHHVPALLRRNLRFYTVEYQTEQNWSKNRRLPIFRGRNLRWRGADFLIQNYSYK